MPKEDLSIPKITPESNSQTESETISDASTGDSILIPKIGTPLIQDKEPTIKSSINPANQNNSSSINSDISNKQFKYNLSPSHKKVLIGIGIFLLVILIYSVVAGVLLFQSGKKLIVSSQKMADLGKAGDLNGMKSEISNVKKSLSSFKRSYILISWIRIVPFVGGYVSDLGHVVNAAGSGLEAGDTLLTVAEPYSDILGFGQKKEEESGEKTTEERIDFLVKTIPDLLPKIDELSSKVKVIDSEIAKIDPDRYPEKYQGKPLRAKVRSAQELVSEITMFIVNGKPVLESAPYLLGMETPRTYLVLFQNDKELRPTGGFMTGYSIMKVDKAKFEPTVSDDIYNLDAKYKPSIPAPDPLIKYIKGPYVLSKNLRFRDMNWSPDFEESMRTVTEAADEVGVSDVDGIIAVDTQLLVNLLNVIGPIGVPGFGNFSTNVEPKCNCPQVIYELESYADVEGPIIWDPLTGEIILKPKNADNRKKIIGPLMNSILANAMGQPKEKLPDLFGAGFKSLMEKHVLFYIHNEDIQKGISDFGLGGSIKDYEGDYLHVNDANLGGRKSNLYVTQEVLQEIEVKRDGSVEKTLTITYKNPEKYDGWLNSVLPNWIRVYVPKGSELIAIEGLEDKIDPYEDLDKTVFAGLFQLRPEGVSKVTFKYKLPFKVSKEYNLLIQKQPGTDGPLYTINLGKYEEEFLLKTDKEIKIRI